MGRMLYRLLGFLAFERGNGLELRKERKGRQRITFGMQRLFAFLLLFLPAFRLDLRYLGRTSKLDLLVPPAAVLAPATSAPSCLLLALDSV